MPSCILSLSHSSHLPCQHPSLPLPLLINERFTESVSPSSASSSVFSSSLIRFAFIILLLLLWSASSSFFLFSLSLLALLPAQFSTRPANTGHMLISAVSTPAVRCFTRCFGSGCGHIHAWRACRAADGRLSFFVGLCRALPVHQCQHFVFFVTNILHEVVGKQEASIVIGF